MHGSRSLPFVALLLTAAACGGQGSHNGEERRADSDVRKVDSSRSYYPLAVGNSWTYRCSAEGEFQFEKTLRITSESPAEGTRFYRVEMTRSNDQQPLAFYLFERADTTVAKAATLTQASSEPLVRSTMRPGERVGSLVAAATERTSAPATGEVEVLRLENFSADNPETTQANRLEWLGRSYARGVGPLVEADGLGNECVLLKYHIASK